MRPPEEIKKQLVKQWLDKAEMDIQAAETLLAAEHPLLYPSCFHSQQAAEIYIKAFHTWHQVEFPKTHTFGKSLNLVGRVDKALGTSLSGVPTLNPYGIEVRYPSNTPDPTRVQADEALKIARSVRKAMLGTLPTLEK
jgi:HEPN domain-containing protein